MVAAIVFRYHIFMIVFLPDGGFKVYNTVLKSAASDPIVGGAAYLLLHAVVVHAARAGQHCRLIYLQPVLMSSFDIIFVAVDKLLGCGKLIHSAKRVVYTGVDYIVDTVEQEHTVNARLRNVAFESLYARGPPVLFYAAGIITQHTSAADSLADDSALHAELDQAARQAVGPLRSRMNLACRMALQSDISCRDISGKQI